MSNLTSMSNLKTDNKNTMNTLIKSIEYIKKEVQYLIDKKKQLNNQEELKDKQIIKQIDNEKKINIQKLKQLTTELNKLKIEEKNKNKLPSGFNNAIRIADSLDFALAKKQKSEDAIIKAKQAKETRLETRDKYLQFLMHEEEYNKYDSEKIPGLLFFHETIIEKYGLCPFIDTNITDKSNTDENITIIKNQLEKSRKEWLDAQNDNGLLYYQLYNKLYEMTEVNNYYIENKKLEHNIDILISSSLSDSQNEIYQWCIEFIEEYTHSGIKTKVLKDKFKTLIHKLSILYAETGLSIHDFLQKKYKQNIIINDLDIQSEQKINDKLKTIITIEEFDKLLDSYTDNIQNLENQQKYIRNILKNLKNNFYLYVTNKVNVDANNTNKDNKQQNFIQNGKYFKKWSQLTKDEQKERFYSYSEYYINKNIKNIDNSNELYIQTKIENLTNLLDDIYKEKKLTSKDFKWNTKKGIIENIKYIEIDSNDNIIYNKNISDDTNNENDKKIKNKKPSNKTLFTKENDKIINELLLVYVIKLLNDKKTSDISDINNVISKEDIDNCCENIKTKLRLKKISNIDKTHIKKKCEEIYSIISNNK
jgi:hypothetical protein